MDSLPYENRGLSKPDHGLNIPESFSWRETSLIGFLHTPTKIFVWFLATLSLSGVLNF